MCVVNRIKYDCDCEYYNLDYCSYMEEAAVLRESISKVRLEELRFGCEDHSREVLKSEAAPCKICLSAKGETDTPAALMGNSKEGSMTGSEGPTSRRVSVKDTPRSKW
jgi:hypothetical protein